MNHQLIALDDPRALESGRVGTKAAGLARLHTAGFDVPEAVVLAIDVLDTWSDGPAPEPIRGAVGEACAALGPRLAVRSSSTWEDGETSAHAGATATVLDVSGSDAVLDAIRHCLDASADAQRVNALQGAVAIVLQRLVDADHAGVAFTADPLTGERDVVRIAATKGLGDALVQGEVVGSDVTIRGSGLEDGSVEGGKVEGDLVDLPIQDARAVATVARAIESSFGRPQDIEWAVIDGHVHVLQARPITVLPVEPRLPEGNNWQKDVAHYPEPLTLFGWSLMQACQDELRGVFDEMGLLVRGLEEEFFGGEIYGRVLPAFGSADSAGKPPPAVVLGIAARIVPTLRQRNAAARRAIELDLPRRWVDEWHRTDRDEMVRRAEDLGAVVLGDLDDHALLEHLDACLALARRGIQIHFRLLMPLAQSLYRLHSLVGDEIGWDDATTASMFAGHSPATRASEDEMARLRTRIRSTPGAAAALERDPAHPVDAVGELDPTLVDELVAWTAEHGWAMVNYDAGVPVLAERPAMITRLLLSGAAPIGYDAASATEEEAREAIDPARRGEFDAALREARAIYPLREDNTIITGDRPLALLRRWMLECADRLMARGAIEARSDATHLTVDELRAVTATGEVDGLSERIVRRRGEEAWVRAHPGPLHVGEQGAAPDTSRLPGPLRRVNEPILWMIGHEYPPPADVPDDAAVLLAGVAASAGVTEGPARIIGGYDEMDRLQDGDVLVCQVTSPSWAPLFPLAAAVVADGGGALSHAAIAAREHGLPAVLGTATGTSTLRDGQRVRVDGTRGLVLECT